MNYDAFAGSRRGFALSLIFTLLAGLALRLAQVAGDGRPVVIDPGALVARAADASAFRYEWMGECDPSSLAVGFYAAGDPDCGPRTTLSMLFALFSMCVYLILFTLTRFSQAGAPEVTRR